MDYIRSVINDYDEKTFKAQPVLNELEKFYPNQGSRAVKISYVRSKLLEKTTLEDGTNAKEYFTKMRKRRMVPDKIPEELAKLRLTNREYMQIKTKQNTALTEKLDNALVVKDADKFIEEILNGLSSTTYTKLFPALLLATGRRSIEIMKTGKLYSRNKKVFFKGMAKGDSNKVIEIPLLADTRKVQKALNKLRKLIPEIKENELDNKELQALMSRRNRAIFEKLSKKYGITLKPHTMRSIYVAYTYQSHGGNMTLNGFASNVLGHGDNYSNLHYVNVRLE